MQDDVAGGSHALSFLVPQALSAALDHIEVTFGRGATLDLDLEGLEHAADQHIKTDHGGEFEHCLRRQVLFHVGEGGVAGFHVVNDIVSKTKRRFFDIAEDICIRTNCTTFHQLTRLVDIHRGSFPVERLPSALM